MRNILVLLLPALLAACQRFAQPEAAEEKSIEFVDQSIDEATSIEPPRSAAPPPPPPPPAPQVEEIFKVVDAPPAQNWNREGYDVIQENKFQPVKDHPVSTFSIDVDRASYSNVRRLLEAGRLPPAGAVRIEEMINYFSYNYPKPAANQPFSVTTEMTSCPWKKQNKLLRIALQAVNLPVEDIPPSNLVFLVDVSGSMNASNKLPLLRQAYRLLVGQLRPSDRVAIVVYAGRSGLLLPSTPGSEKRRILSAIESLRAGGSTAGAEGIRLAYQVAEEHFIKGGNNRVILATDGDFNVGVSSDVELVSLIEEKRKAGVFLSVLGFGTGNYQDAKMEKLAGNGNGNYAYIDKLQEARKVLVSEFSGTLYTVAKDVKIQIEFNPAKVGAYRLLGYENRLLEREDFNDDTKDAGEIGAGHQVTALYELVPADVSSVHLRANDELAYQEQRLRPEALNSNEWLTAKLRYKKPDAQESELLVEKVEDKGIGWQQASPDFRFAASVAGFGQLLRRSKFIEGLSYEAVAEQARQAKGTDREGYRAEFIQLVELAKVLEASR